MNAAQVNNHKDLVTYEFGGNQTADGAGSARGEGGVYNTMGNMVYGAHFGGASTTANGMRAATGLTGADEDNNIDVFVGGDAGMKWGANLGYSKTADETSPLSAESMRTRLGVIHGDTQAYANINLINNAQGDTLIGGEKAKFNGELGYQIGVIHAWEGNSLFADFRQFDGESEIGSSKKDISVKQLQVGAGRVTRLNDKTNLFTKGFIVKGDVENDRTTGAAFGNAGCDASVYACEEYSTLRLPVVVGLETDATSWLALRASISQVVWGSEEDKDNERSIANSTTINAGATLKFGELSVDGVIGNNDGTGASVGENTAAGGGTLRTDVLMSRVSMTYRF